jgi:hypothetical protein
MSFGRQTHKGRMIHGAFYRAEYLIATADEVIE